MGYSYISIEGTVETAVYAGIVILCCSVHSEVHDSFNHQSSTRFFFQMFLDKNSPRKDSLGQLFQVTKFL